MKQNRRHLIIIILYIGFLLASCWSLSSCGDDPDDIAPDLTTPAEEVLPAGRPGQQLARTLIVYMAGENSLSPFVNDDIKEMVQGLPAIPDSARVVVMVDDTRSTRLSVGTSTSPLQQVKVFDENICTTSCEGMEQLLSFIVQNYPADHYGLVLWSHGSGWVFHGVSPSSAAKVQRRSFGFDNGNHSYDNKGAELDIPDLAEVLSHFPRFEYIFFDACFMQSIEVAYELRGVTDYLIASPAEIPGPGSPYDRLLPLLCQVPADVESATREYVSYYEARLAGSPYYGAELSLIKTSALDRLAAASAPCLQALLANRQEPFCSSVQRYCFSTDSNKFTEFYDWKNWMYQSRHLLGADDYAAWCAAYDEAVPVTALSPTWFSAIPVSMQREMADADHCGGVSIFIPAASYDRNGWVEAYHRLSWYEATGISKTGW